jgi:diamine N-acetyltransferase
MRAVTLLEREGPRSRLEVALASARRGQGQIVSIEGEAGIGKTSLALGRRVSGGRTTPQAKWAAGHLRYRHRSAAARDDQLRRDAVGCMHRWRHAARRVRRCHRASGLQSNRAKGKRQVPFPFEQRTARFAQIRRAQRVVARCQEVSELGTCTIPPMQVDIQVARESDTAAIVELESRAEFAAYIFRWEEQRHRHAIHDPDKRYFVTFRADGSLAAYAILPGVQSPHRNVELVRILCAIPGQGLGRLVLQRIIAIAFDEIGAHRLWLDVFSDNDRARHVYRTAGFSEEGVLREAVLHDGRWRSLVIMSMLESERVSPGK